MQRITYKQKYVNGVKSGAAQVVSSTVRTATVATIVHMGTKVAAPAVTYQTYTQTDTVPRLAAQHVDDPSLFVGEHQTVAGHTGTKTVTYKQKYIDGVKSGSPQVVSSTITKRGRRRDPRRDETERTAALDLQRRHRRPGRRRRQQLPRLARRIIAVIQRQRINDADDACGGARLGIHQRIRCRRRLGRITGTRTSNDGRLGQHRDLRLLDHARQLQTPLLKPRPHLSRPAPFGDASQA